MMDPSPLLDDLKRCKEPAGGEVLRKLIDFNSQNKDWFGSPIPHFKDYSGLIGILFTHMRECYEVASGKDDADEMSKVTTSEALKELFTCLRILSRAKEFTLIITKDKSYSTSLLLYGDILAGDNDKEVSKRPSAKGQVLRNIHDTEIEALKVVCNCVFHSTDFREEYKKHCCSKHITNKLGSLAMEEDLDCRRRSILIKILFLMSALDTNDRDNMRFVYNTVSILVGILEGSLKMITEIHTNSGDADNKENLKIYIEQITETLKTLFNISVSVSDDTLLEDSECQNFCLLVEILYRFLSKHTSLQYLQQGLIGHAANMLINIPKSCLNQLTPTVKRRKWEDPIPMKDGYPLEYELKDMSAVITLVFFLDDELKRGCDMQGDKSGAFSIMVSLCHACRCLRLVRKYLRLQILPPLKEVPVRPEESKTLKGRIIKLMTHPDTNIKNIAADFLFVLCKENPDRLVKHTGYGNAAGLFAARGLLGGRKENTTIDYSSDDDDSETEEYAAIVDKVNPITGGIAAANSHENPLANMTEEEKEASATELINLIDKMSSLDVIKPMGIGEDGQPKEIDIEEAKRLVKARLDRDKTSPSSKNS